jgi:hypothetical protein
VKRVLTGSRRAIPPDPAAKATARAGLLVFAAVAGCSPAPPIEIGDLDLPSRAPPRGAAFVLTWNGARIGGAVEELRPAGDGYQFRRAETFAVRRSSTVVHSRTEIRIDADHRLRARSVDVTSETGATRTRGTARRRGDGDWIVSWDLEPPWRVPADAVPAELVLHQMAAQGRRSFAGPVFLPGYGFATAHLRIEPAGGDRVRATATTSLGQLASTIALAADGTADSIVSAQPLAAHRVDRSQLRQPFDPPEIVDSSAIPLSGARSPRIAIAGARRPLPAAVPGQIHTECADTWFVDTAPTAVAHRRTIAELRSLARQTAQTLADGADTPTASARQALALGRGDCTAHARLFADLARSRGFDVQLVTGFRADGGRMVRHRWAIARADSGWIAVDPTWGEAPIPAGRVVALAAHGDSAREIGVADELAFRGLGEARARYMKPSISALPCDRSIARTRRSDR